MCTKQIRQRLKGLVLCKMSQSSKIYDRLGEGSEERRGVATTTLNDATGNSMEVTNHYTEDEEFTLYGSVTVLEQSVKNFVQSTGSKDT